MNSILSTIKSNFTLRVDPLPAGMHHYKSPAEDPLNYRMHLRIEANGSGILVINAATVLHLNQTAAEYAYYILKQTPAEEAAAIISRRYRIGKNQAGEDFRNFRQQIDTMITTPDLDPVTYLDIDRHSPYSDDLSAPYRLDCALTYQLPEGSSAHAAPQKRVERELGTEEWKTILDKAWAAGIPHILFTGGEPTLRDDLPELIEHAEKNGQVTGLLTDGLKLGDTAYLNGLLQAGLDHTMIVLEPDKKQSWKSLSSFTYWSETLNEDIFVAAHLTLTDKNVHNSLEMINKLTEAGVSAISLSESDKSLTEQLQVARDYVNEKDIELIWDLPVPYSKLNPVALELEAEEEAETIAGAGKGWLYVEPDGDVLPDQGINVVLGNLLRDDWITIWGEAKRKN